MPEHIHFSTAQPNRNELESALKQISLILIAAHKNGRRDVLATWARRAGIADAEWQDKPSRLFMKTIRVYHPDRLQHYVDELARLQSNADHAGVAAILRTLGGGAVLPAATGPVFSAESGQGGAAEPEEYTFNFKDFGFDSSNWDAHDTAAPIRPERKRRRGITFMEALRRECFGNLDLHLSAQEMEDLEGELDLVDLGIDDLSGAGRCRNLTGLNLSCNAIHDVAPLRALKRLVTLDLSHNNLDEADALENLTRLEELDLSGNTIDDIGFLDGMARLKVVDLTGNPVRDAGTIARLHARGVVVVR